MRRAFGLTAALLLAPSIAHAGGFTPWGTITGDKTMAISPYFFVGSDGSVTNAPYLFFGASDYFDIMVGYGFTLTPSDPTNGGDPSVSSGAIEIMPRAAINDYAVFALHALYTPGDDSAVAGVEFHGVAAGEFVAFTYNAGWWPVVGGTAGFNAGSVFGIFVPEFIINERFSVFTEFNPAVDLSTGTPEFGANVVPGLTFYVDKDLNHSITAAATMAVAPNWGGATFGLLYWTAIDLGKSSGGTSKRDRALDRERSVSRAFAPRW